MVGRVGLSIVEVLVAIVILGVVSAAIVALLPGLTRTSIAANNDVESTQIVQSMFERLQAAWANPAADVWVSGASVMQADARLAIEMTAAGLDDLCGASSSVLTTIVDSTVVPYGLQVTVECAADGALPSRTLMRAFGDPR